jgi:hypothetical protein
VVAATHWPTDEEVTTAQLLTVEAAASTRPPSTSDGWSPCCGYTSWVCERYSLIPASPGGLQMVVVVAYVPLGGSVAVD